MSQKLILHELMPSLKNMVDLSTLKLFLVSRHTITLDQAKELTVSEACNRSDIILKLVEILCQYSDCARLLLSVLEEIEEKGDGTTATSELITTLKEKIAHLSSPTRTSPRESPQGREVRRRNRQRRTTLSDYESSQSLVSISEARNPDTNFERTQSDMVINQPRRSFARIESLDSQFVISSPNDPPPQHLVEEGQLVFSLTSSCVLKTHAIPIGQETVTMTRPIQCTVHSDLHPAVECKHCVEEALNTYTLMDATDKITTEYAKFVLKTKLLVEARCSLQDVLLFFVQKYSPNVPGNSFFPDIARIKQSTSFHELMDKFGPYMSWFEYGPLVLLCQTFCGEDGDALVTEYEHKLREYLKNCVHECPLISQDNPPQDYSMFSVKLAWNWDKTNYFRVKNFKRTLSSILKSNPQSFFLKEIKMGCVLLTFLAPTEICDQLERLAMEFPNALAVHDVLGVIIGDKKIVIQQTLLKFSWTGSHQAELNGRTNADLETMHTNSSAITGNAAFTDLPDYFQTQDELENNFTSQLELSQPWEFPTGCLNSIVVVSGSDYQTSGSDDYPQSPLSTEQSQKSSTSYSTNKESQNEFDENNTHLQTTGRSQETDVLSIKSLDRSPQGSGYIFTADKHTHVQAASTNISTSTALQSAALQDGLSREQSLEDDKILTVATEAPPSDRESKPMSHKHVQLSRMKTAPLSNIPSKHEEQIFARRLCRSLTQLQQQQRWSAGANGYVSQHLGAMLETEQELITNQNSHKSQSESSPEHKVAPNKELQPNFSEVKKLSESSTPTNKIGSDNGISSQSSHQVKPSFSVVLPSHQPGINSQSSLRRIALNNSQVVESDKRDSLDSGYIGDSKRSSALSSCSTPNSPSPRGSFSFKQQSPACTVSPRSSMAQRERTISPLANLEVVSAGVKHNNPDTATSESTSITTQPTVKVVEPIYENCLHPMEGVVTGLLQNGETKSDSCTRQQVCEEVEATRQQMTSTGIVCQNKRLSKRKKQFRQQYSQQSTMLNKESAGPPSATPSCSPANTDATNIKTEPTSNIPTIVLVTTENSHSSSEANIGIATPNVGDSSSKVKLLCRPLQSRRRSREITEEESSNSLQIVDQSMNEANSQEKEEVSGYKWSTQNANKPVNLSSDIYTPKTEKKKSTVLHNSSILTHDHTLSQLGADEVAGMHASLGRQSSISTLISESESTLCPSSLDFSCFSTLDRNEIRLDSGLQQRTVSLRSNASGRSDPGYQTDKEYSTPTASNPSLLHYHQELAGHRSQKKQLNNIMEPVNSLPHGRLSDDDLTPTEVHKHSENPLLDIGYGTYKCNGTTH